MLSLRILQCTGAQCTRARRVAGARVHTYGMYVMGYMRDWMEVHIRHVRAATGGEGHLWSCKAQVVRFLNNAALQRGSQEGVRKIEVLRPFLKNILYGA